MNGFSKISKADFPVTCTTGYRFGFNGQEKVDEISGLGNHNTAEYWEYDTRLGRRWNIDPVVKPWMSSYHAFSNNPIAKIDPNGAKDDWVEGADGNITWRDDVTSANDKDLKSNETYRGLSYKRDKIWSNVNIGGNVENGLMSESYNSDRTMTYVNNTPWVDRAFEEMGKGISETGSNPEITKYWQFTQMPEAAKQNNEDGAYARWVLGTDKEAWCAAFVNYNLETSGVQSTMHALASNFDDYGQNLGRAPVYGSIALMNYSHVGFVVGLNTDGRVILLGGNQKDAVNLSPNSQSAVLKYVYPSGHSSTKLSLPRYNLKARSLTNATSR